MTAVIVKVVKPLTCNNGQPMPEVLADGQEIYVDSPFKDSHGPVIRRDKSTYSVLNFHVNLAKEYLNEHDMDCVHGISTYQQAIQIARNVIRRHIECALNSVQNYCELAIVDSANFKVAH